ncbi:MAG TPA: hypothetical protein VJ957_06855 [Longimicrobiales bacterium]|nr:hypothetical protein [Longimicrobiales bacterium]
MRSIRIAAASVLALVLALAMHTPAAAQTAKAVNVAGKWEITSETPRGASTMTLTLAQDGATVTGTATMRRGDVAIKDGKVDGNNLSFTVTFGGGERTFEMQYKATVDGDTMKGTISGGRGDRPFTGKRVS